MENIVIALLGVAIVISVAMTCVIWQTLKE